MKLENDAFATTFTISITPEEVWPKVALQVADKTEGAADAAAGTQVWLPGWEMTGEILDTVHGKKLSLRKDAQPCEGTEILIELEAEGSGTRVRLVQSGFGTNPQIALNLLGIGADFIFRDFALFLETGVIAHRHMNAWSVFLGADTQETPAGLTITNVVANTLADRAGLRSGDQLVTLAGSNVVSTRDLWIALRTQRGVERIELAWVRGREKMTGYGAM